LKSHHTIVNGGSREMNLLPGRSVHLVITSPPYWQLKDYGTENQIGFHESYESYINNLNLVWNECERVLHPGCRLCINIGDQFARQKLNTKQPDFMGTEYEFLHDTVKGDFAAAIVQATSEVSEYG
jgi:DNA modification methylase